MRFRLRTLMIVMAVTPMVLAGVWFDLNRRYSEWQLERQRRAIAPYSGGVQHYGTGAATVGQPNTKLADFMEDNLGNSRPLTIESSTDNRP